MDLSNLLPAITDACSLNDARRRIASPSEPLILGVNDAAKAATVACLARQANAPVLVIVPRPQHAQALCEELEAWLGTSIRVLHFPERDALPYERLDPDPDVLRDRLRAVHALDAGEPCVVIASGLALSQRTLPSNDAPAIAVTSAGELLDADGLIADLLRFGYTVQALVEQPGGLARRGGIIDVFPATDDAPVRLELLGDVIESIRRFDPDTQRSQERLDEIAISAAREVIDLPQAIATLAERLDLSDCNRVTREQFEQEIAQARAGAHIDDHGFYVPFLAEGSLLDHLPDGGLLIIDEPVDLSAALAEHQEQSEEIRNDLEARGELPRGLPKAQFPPEAVHMSIDERRRIQLSRWAVDERSDPDAPRLPAEAQVTRLPFAPVDAYGGRLRALSSDVAQTAQRGRAIVIVSQQSQRLAEVLREEGIGARLDDSPAAPEPGAVAIVHGSLPQGWRLTVSQPPITLITDAETFGFVKQRRRLPRRTGASRDAFLAELSPGDYVVHIEHGIGRFVGLITRRIDEIEREYLELRYAQGDRLFVPAEQIDRLSKYVGGGDVTPSLTRLGSQEWTRAKARVRRAVHELAKQLLELYAARQFIEGRAFSSDSAWQQELEGSFPYVETPDQLAAVRAVKADMEAPRPMDRLVCGDVGYGKTEVALRAAFKAVMDGTQAAVLVPTTVLAQQHFSTFTERLAGFPVRVDLLSRFRSDREQRATVTALGEGSVDIIIGTHRLLQKDVAIKDLGLVIIDEEQRFGVAHKERLKEMRQAVDVLTLSATPIPRTLHMSLSGIRDMSTMETPPEQRLPIKTYVTEFDDRLVREAILRELERGGQVYFVHNRVHDIELVAAHLRELVPEAEIGIGHGQQHEDALEQVMLDFVSGRIDVLVCTTIIESGLDIPNVNTIIIDKADKLGLAQLYQLRGRVGRGAARAYAYLLFEKHRSLSETAQKRLQAIFEATELGAGFQIALRDLEIRGAGNLLGADQSGQIGAVGFDLYVRLLADAVERLKALREGRQPPVPKTQQSLLTIDLPFTAHLPPAYVPELNLRLALYQRMAAVETLEEANNFDSELRDRFGPPPPAAENLLFAVRARALARAAGATAVQQEDGHIVVHVPDGTPPRDRLRGTPLRGVSAGPTQARLNLEQLSEHWPETLLDVLGALSKA